MLRVNTIEKNLKEVKLSLEKRNWSPERIVIVEETIDLNNRRKALQTELDQEKSQLNQLSGQIGDLFKAGKKLVRSR